MMKKNTPVKWWLVSVATMVFLMVFIGGVTRLTDSGLSMVDWRPIMGVIPPLNEASWQKTFEAYQKYPEYKLINSTMTLEGFKKIFFWEWFHRLFGRLIGLAFFLPFVYFLVTKRLSKDQTRKYSIAFILGGSQGLLGWYMVKSGLVTNPDVSHFRLAAHLSLAFLIIAYIYWLILELDFNRKDELERNKTKTSIPLAFLFFLVLQIIYGAFVAGLDAGLTHNTFPKMGRSWIPQGLFEFSPYYINFLENPVSIQFVHRYLGYFVFVLGVFTAVKLFKTSSVQLSRSAIALVIALVLQVVLGVLTLVWYVPIWTASMHQLGACLLLLITTRTLFFSHRTALDIS